MSAVLAETTSHGAWLESLFDVAFEAPGGIARLRQLILSLAMQGKLVAQDPKGPPASELLKQIAAEKAALMNAGKVRAPKPLAPIADAEKPYAIPASWEWVRFGDIAQHNSGKTLDGGRNAGQFRDYITTSNLYWGRFQLENVRQMRIRDDELERCTAKKGDLLICEGGEAGRAAVWNSEHEVCFQNHVHRARFYSGIDPVFAYRLFEKLNGSGEIEQYRKGVGISNMSSRALASIAFPLPPLEEQKCIVARVDELMARCDELESRRIEREDKRREARTTAVRQWLAGNDAAVALLHAHFAELFAGRHDVAELRKAILQLAVMGKLVVQDMNSASATELLKEIEAEKLALVEAGKIKSPKPLSPIVDTEKPYAIPASWEWARLGSLATYGPNNGFSPKPVDYETKVKTLSLSATTSGKFNPRFFKFVEVDVADDSDLWLRDGDILVQRGNTLEYVGVPAVYRGESNQFIYPDLMMRIRLSTALDVGYVHAAMSSDECRNFLRQRASGTSGTMPKISQETLRCLPIPVPPLEEQKRIVARIDRLMQLCDTLEQNIDCAQTKQVELLDAVMARV